MMILVGALGAAFVYRWGRELYGVPAGLLATFLYAFSPNLLAHTRLITPDIALTVFAFGATFFFWRSLESQSGRDVLWAGALLGLALLSKFTALLWLPLFAALLAVWSIRTGQRPPRRALAVCGVAGAVLLLGYGFDLTPYVEGIAFQLEHAEEGHPAFFAGRHADGGWWYYALMSLLLKTPAPSLLLLGASAIRLARRRNRSRWLDESFVVLPPLAVIAFFSFQHQSIGLRYVLPALPFLFVFASGVLATGRPRGLARVALAGLLAWVLAASLSIYPHYLAYFNETVGGPARGYRYLVDSNLDWGQDLEGLAKFMRERDIERVHLSYFGTDSPARYGIRYDWLPSYHLERPNRTREFHIPHRGWFAISATHLQGVYLPDRDIYAFLREQEPVARIGYSIFVYHLE
jgi:4-amino-4-deoxy-L-arabinose transferase-like glycosyltransferase